MLRMLVCCGGGFSSSFMARNVEKSIRDGGYEDKIKANFIPFSHVWEIAKDYDIAFLCPHLRYQVPKMMEEHGSAISIPLTVIAPKMYGTMRLADMVSDAVELIEIYQNDPDKNQPVRFPDESDAVRIERAFSHKVSVDHKKNDIDASLAYFEEVLARK